MRKGQNQDVCVVNNVVVNHVRKTSKTNTPKLIAENRPAIGVSCDPFDRPVDLISEFEPEPVTAPLVPPTSVSVLFGCQPMKANVDFGHVGSLAFFSQFGP